MNQHGKSTWEDQYSARCPAAADQTGECRTSDPLRVGFPGGDLVGRGVVAAPRVDRVVGVGAAEAVRQADVDLAEGPVAGLLRRVVAERVAQPEARDDGRERRVE